MSRSSVLRGLVMGLCLASVGAVTGCGESFLKNPKAPTFVLVDSCVGTLFYKPSGIAALPDGKIYLVESGAVGSVVHRVRRMGQCPASNDLTFGGPQCSGGDSGICMPLGIALDKSGNVYIADNRNQRIVVLTDSLTYRFEIPLAFFPNACAIDDNTLYVTGSADAVSRYTLSGEPLGSWGSPGRSEGQFSDPQGIAIGLNNVVYVADANNRRVQRFSAVGAFQGSTAVPGKTGAIAAERDGFVFVVDHGDTNDRVNDDDTLVRVYDRDMNYLAEFGRYRFTYPGGIAILPNGDVVVTDDYARKLLRFRPVRLAIASAKSPPTRPGRTFAR